MISPVRMPRSTSKTDKWSSFISSSACKVITYCRVGILSSDTTHQNATSNPTGEREAWTASILLASAACIRDGGGPTFTGRLFLCLLNVVGDSLGAVFDVQLLQNLAHVVFDGLLAEVQPLSDLFVDQPLRHEAQNLRLAWG